MPPVSLLAGQPLSLGSRTTPGAYAQLFAIPPNQSGRHTLAVQMNYPGGTTSTTCTAQVYASLDGFANAFPVGSTMTLSGTTGSVATLDIAGFGGCLFQLSLATLALGTGATQAIAWVNFG